MWHMLKYKKKKWSAPMSYKSHSKQMNGKSINMQQETEVMLQLAELLFQEKLISPDEKFRLTQLIRKGGA